MIVVIDVQQMASVVSFYDLWQQAKAFSPRGTQIPSQEWLGLQFWSKNKYAKVSIQYTGRLKVKYMAQQQHWRKKITKIITMQQPYSPIFESIL